MRDFFAIRVKSDLKNENMKQTKRNEPNRNKKMVRDNTERVRGSTNHVILHQSIVHTCTASISLSWLRYVERTLTIIPPPAHLTQSTMEAFFIVSWKKKLIILIQYTKSLSIYMLYGNRNEKLRWA